MSEIKAYNIISEYRSDDSIRHATVVKEIGTKRYIVRMMNDSGSYFTASTENIDAAEDIADEWVRK